VISADTWSEGWLGGQVGVKKINVPQISKFGVDVMFLLFVFLLLLPLGGIKIKMNKSK